MKVLITGSKGFIGVNLKVHLKFLFKDKIEIYEFTEDSHSDDLQKYISNVDFIFHLAGINRPTDPKEFITGNVGLTQKICDLCLEYNKAPIVYTSSIQAEQDSDYGRSKFAAEEVLKRYARKGSVACYIFRLPNVFGKWAVPHYNSFVTTLCHNIAHGLPVTVDELSKQLSLIYIDDVIKGFIDVYQNHVGLENCVKYMISNPIYTKSLGEIVDLIRSFKNVSESLVLPVVAKGFERALYATYLSYLSSDNFVCDIEDYSDERGSFYEVLKTSDSGQVSISTTKPGITRGNHFHHTKNEKFLVVKGEALFRFRHLLTGEIIEIRTNDKKKQFVEVPVGYTHNFTNTGDDELIVLLWANEVFDRNHPDTYFLEV